VFIEGNVAMFDGKSLRGICILTPTLKCNCDFAIYYSQFSAILPLVNGQNRGKYAKIKGKIAMTSEK